MKKCVCALLLAVLLACCLSAGAEESLAGIWRFAGGAEVMGYGFILEEDGVCTFLTTDDLAVFPPERLIALDTAASWELSGDELIIRNDRSQRRYPVEVNGNTIHLAEGDGGGFYERCGMEQIVALQAALPEDVRVYLDSESEFWDAHIEDFLIGEVAYGARHAYVLVKGEGGRTLLGFREVKGSWTHYLTAKEAIPQGEGLSVGLSFLKEGEYRGERLWDDEGKYAGYTDAPLLTIYVGNEEMLLEHAEYEWRGGDWWLTGYQYDAGQYADILGDWMIFYDIGGAYEIRADVKFDTRIASVDFAALPTDQYDAAWDEAEQEQPVRLKQAWLSAVEMDFPANQKYPVYLGPGEGYGRSGDGKAVVSTNDTIEVYGAYDGWVLIQYTISEHRGRIGWINGNVLPDSMYIPEMELVQYQWWRVAEYCNLTDDPMGCERVLVGVPGDLEVERLAELGEEWTLVRFERKGREWWGFLPSGMLAEHMGNG